MAPLSYSEVSKKNRLPESEQPHPDPGLLEHSDHDLSQSGASDDKVHIVTREEFEHDSHPVDDDTVRHGARFTADDAAPTPDETARKAQADVQKVEAKAKQAKDAAEDKAKQAEEKAKQTKDTVEAKAKETKDTVETKAKETKDTVEAEAKKDYAAAKSEAKKDYAKAEKEVGKAVEATKEEYELLSEKAKSAYNKMSKEARDDWHKLSKESKKRWEEAKNSDAGRELQKPEVWGSLLGVTNLAVLGGVAYVAFANWNKPRWDRRVVSATVIGLGTWFGLQGWLIPQTDAVKQRRS